MKVGRDDYPDRPEWVALAAMAARSAQPPPPARPVAPPPPSTVPDGAESALTGTGRKQLHRALLSAYPSEDALRQMLDFEMSVSLSQVSDGSLSDRVFQVIKWAEATGRLEELIAGAHTANPGNSEMVAFVQSRLG